ncbi:MAG: phosphoglucomutase [bacterium]|nr:MAG: phosphoglucomutase [bacterium]
MIDKNIQLKAQEWLSQSYDQKTRNEIKSLMDSNNKKELTDRFYKELDFGTGGLRGVLGAGTNRMNIYTVGKMAQGLANYLLKTDPGSKDKGLVIAYDSRNMSTDFSLRSALIFGANGIRCYLFKSLRSTPMLSFAIRHLKAISGLVITASHNPREYNGIKVYYEDGAQVLPPHDQGIIDEVRAIRSVDEIKLITENQAIKAGLLTYLDDDVDEAYYQKVLGLSIHPEIIKEVQDRVKIVFTPLHGTGNIPVREVLERAGFNHVAVVPEQEKPDGNFPTVDYPNPEESAALKLAIDLAKSTSSQLVLASDPDADRVGIAVNNGRNEFVLFNGNQVGVILTYYILSQYKALNRLPKNGLIVKTIVTTDLSNTMCRDFGVEMEEVLTGFKYIAGKVHQYHDIDGKSKEYLFGFEESYGYNMGDFVRDKDAVSSCLLIAELTAWCTKHNMTLLDYLDQIYEQYGYYLESLDSIRLKGKEGLEKIQGILKDFRNHPPQDIGGSQVVRIRDVLTGQMIDLSSHRESKINLPRSNVITYYLANGGKVTLRPSGTEPKIKFYFSYFHRDETKALEEVKVSVKNDLDHLQKSFMAMVQAKL